MTDLKKNCEKLTAVHTNLDAPDFSVNFVEIPLWILLKLAHMAD